ncbi:nicotinamide mononucleotide permease [Leucosporidium creatinivorum]|uniref:Nicotinamide mononucleotide permease n=1 Tax=Leucosporidium creatinivorum TaxID=106004 RepID=A0A1Y2G2J8_9BASI|nr:nicotinamide mononucleotide permease [Leucosporidium creatinivorum]
MSDIKATTSYEEKGYAAESHEIPLPAILASKTEEELKAIKKSATWKMDLFIMPAMILMYIFNYLDRQNIAAAKLAGITVDLKLTPVEYQMCISFLFVGYILMQVPSNMIASKIARPGLYICGAMALWGALSAITAGVHNFAGLVVCRFMLGFVESVFFPGAMFYLSTFYNKTQFATRVSILYTGSQLGNAFGGLFAIAIFKLDGMHGIEGWKWLFIIEGVATVGLAGAIACFLPNKPSTMKQLTEEERALVLHGLAREQGASDDASEITAGRAFIMAVTDPKTWLLMGILYCTYIAAAVVSFFPSVVGTLGYSRNITLVLTAPPYLLASIVMVINGWHSDKQQERFWHIAIPLGVAVIANAIAISTLNTGARYLAMMLFPTALYGSAVVTLSWIAGSLTQPSVKRATCIALINASCNTPNVWTPYLYKAPPRYLNAFSLNLAASALAIVFAIATRLYLQKKNAELARGDISARGAPTQRQLAGGFRYLL